MIHGIVFEGSEHHADPDRYHSPLRGFQCRLPLYTFTDPAIEEINLKLRDVLRELHSLLIRYQWRPTVEDYMYTRLNERMLWDETKSGNSEESGAIQYLLRQIDLRYGPFRILRFRKCEECAAWFYAVKDTQIYCRESCRQRHAIADRHGNVDERQLHLRSNNSERWQRSDQRPRWVAGHWLRHADGQLLRRQQL
jgi:hypothetical protein